MRLCLLTQDRRDPSFRIRWERFLPAFAGAGCGAPVAGGGGGRGRAFRAAAEADTVVLHRRLFSAWDFARLRRAAKRLVYDFDDALCYRPVPPHRSGMRARRFFRAVAGSDLVFAGSGFLARLARLRAARVHVVPSTVDVERYEPAPKRTPFTAVWIGQSVTLPHLETVR